jgi:hypothetical protein
MASKVKGYILEETTSHIDGAPIVVIATMKSANVKTGNMAQVWILRSDMAPTDAVKNGCDSSICGDCPHRGNGNLKNRTCYVTVFQAPLAVYKMYKRGGYAKWNGSTEMFQGRKIRWGAYGDPSLISSDIVRNINAVSDGWTGYTHQWTAPFASAFVDFFQASCDSVADLTKANDTGWSTFTVLPVGYNSKELGRKVTICPASLSDDVQCIECGKCDGRGRNVVIEAHGTQRYIKGH